MRAKENVSVFRAFLAACLRANMFEDLLTMYREAEANEWPTLTDIGDIVIKAMHAQGCSRNELWAFYKTSVEKTRLTIELPTMVTLLTSGVTVNEIRSLKYSGDWEMEKWLICALTELDRVDEARDIVREILAQERRTALPILVLVPLLEVLIQSGFRVEAQTLADQQALLDVQLHGAIYFYLKSVIQPLTGLRAYETLEAIEGSHRQSLIVQALLIKRCYEDRTLTKAMYKASFSLSVFFCFLLLRVSWLITLLVCFPLV